jgi:hypothetical protein
MPTFGSILTEVSDSHSHEYEDDSHLDYGNALMIEEVCMSKMLAYFYRTTQSHILESCHLQYLIAANGAFVC